MCAIRWWHTKHTNACARVSLIKFSNQNQDTSPTQIGIWNREPVRCYSYKLPPSCASTWTRRWVLGAAPSVGGDIESHRRRRRAQLSLNELILRDDCSGEEGRWNWRLNGAHKQTITQADKQTSRQRDVPHMDRNTQTWTDTDTVRNNTDTNKGRYVLLFEPTIPSITSLVNR